VEGHALAQREGVDRAVLGDLPAGRQRRLDLQRAGFVAHQPVIDVHQDAEIVDRGHRGGVERLGLGDLADDQQPVIDALVEAYLGASGAFALRLMAGLRAAAASGGDSRGLLSAALLILARDRAPVTLRVDWSLTPLDALEELHMRATRGPYAGWSADVPTLDAPHRTCGGGETGGDDSGNGDWWSRGGSNP
jgi:hypothetical protein